MIFASNYSESLVERTEYGQNVPDSVVDAAELNVKLDMSSEFAAVIYQSQNLIVVRFRLADRHAALS